VPASAFVEGRRRKTGLRLILWLLPLAAALALALYAFWIEPRSLTVTRLSLPMPGLEREVRLVVMGDLQPAGPIETLESVAGIVERMNAEAGDLVLLLGDYVSTRRLATGFLDPYDTVPILGRLKAPLGVYAVLGNHDWWWDGPEMRRVLADQGITVLEDSAERVDDGGQTLWIAGLSDPVTQAYDVEAALAQTDLAQTGGGGPVLLLAHTPDVFPEVPSDVGLTLAGHTHGGQVDLPFLGRLIVPSRFGDRFAYGLIEEAGRRLYVTSGIGTAIIPVRFRVPPEIAVITLKPATDVATIAN
jgi:predicted MPP superfamily phosphohydrolase